MDPASRGGAIPHEEFARLGLRGMGGARKIAPREGATFPHEEIKIPHKELEYKGCSQSSKERAKQLQKVSPSEEEYPRPKGDTMGRPRAPAIINHTVACLKENVIALYT